MAKTVRRSLSIALGAVATTMLGGCYYGDVYSSSYAAGSDCAARYGPDYYDYDGYAYDDGYGYNCYDSADYSGGFLNIGFGGGWYDNYYYPGYGLWLFDSYRNRYPLRGHYLDHWGGRRAWWKHHKDRPGGGGWTHPGKSDHDGRPDRPGGWNRGDRDGPKGTRPGRRPDLGSPSDNPRPVTGTPGPDRTPGAIRPQRPEPRKGDVVRPGPWRERPSEIPVTANPTPDRQRGMQRAPRNWSPSSPPQTPEVGRGPRPAPAAGQPGGFRSRPATPPPVAAPPPPAARSGPAPETRPQRPVREKQFERSLPQ